MLSLTVHCSAGAYRLDAILRKNLCMGPGRSPLSSTKKSPSHPLKILKTLSLTTHRFGFAARTYVDLQTVDRLSIKLPSALLIMAFSHHSLLELPFVVRNDILGFLQPRDLVSVSQSCRCLHGEVLKHLYRDLTFRNRSTDEIDRDRVRLIELNLRNDPTLLPYIRSITLSSPPFFNWMFTHASRPSPESLDVNWDLGLESGFLELLMLPPIRNTIRELRTRWSGVGLSSFHHFHELRSLKLDVPHRYPSLTLQSLLEQLHALHSLERLEVHSLTNWAIQWKPSFEHGFRNLRGLMIEVWDSGVGGNGSNPSEVDWDTIMTMYRKSILFWNDHFAGDDICNDMFLELAPSRARMCGLDPVAFTQWRVKSRKMFLPPQLIFLSPIPVGDLTIILQAMKSVDFDVEHIEFFLPTGTTSSIAQHLPNVTSLSVGAQSVLDSSVIPACIRSLPKLEALEIAHLQIWRNNWQLSRKCTAATCSFPAFPDAMNVNVVNLEISRSTDCRSTDAVWEVQHRLLDETGNAWDLSQFKKFDGGEQVREIEVEVGDWFQLNRSLESVILRFDVYD